MGELDRCHNVCNECREQEGSHRPKNRSKVVQEFCVGIDPVGPHVDLKIPEQMSQNIQDQEERGEGDDIFFPDGRLVKGDQGILGKLPGSHGGNGRDRHSDEAI